MLSVSSTVEFGGLHPQCSSVVISSRSKSMCTLKVFPILKSLLRDSLMKMIPTRAANASSVNLRWNPRWNNNLVSKELCGN